MNDKRTFGEFVTQKRKEAGLTQKSFAEKLFVSESAVSKWERGISFPDITLIRDICTILNVNEHELLTASEDLESRNIEKFAKKYLKMMKRIQVFVSIIFSISLIASFICNIAIFHTLSWFFLVLTGELVALSITLLPIIVSKNKGLITLGAFVSSITLLLFVCNLYVEGNWFLLSESAFLLGMTIVFLPFVLSRIGLTEFAATNKAFICFCIDTVFILTFLLICSIVTKGNWFFSTALPIAGVSLLLPWIMLLIIRYTKLNVLFKTAACFGSITIFISFINGFISRILNDKQYNFWLHAEFNNWQGEQIGANINMIIIIFFLIFILLFTVGGIIKTIQTSKKKNA